MVFEFQEIPQTWLVVILFFGLIILRMFGIDSFTTAGISLIIGYVTGKHIQQTREPNLTNVTIKK